MSCSCGQTCLKWTTLTLSVIFLILGIVLAVIWKTVFQNILYHQLSVFDTSTQGFKNWKETPIPMFLEFHLYNWTNPEQVEKDPGVKPIFVEVGPYVFYEHHIRENITFNNNDTLTYYNKRTWKFRPDLTKGTLDDYVTFLNPIAAIVADRVKDQNYLVRRAVNFFLEENLEGLSVTRKVRQVLFDGYDDPLITIASKLNISGLHLPFKKFGWFVDRNNSVTYDGVYNMYSGGQDISKLGLITRWNYENVTSYYPGKCGIINGTSGELWYPPRNDEEVSVFAPDLCSSVNLHKNGTDTLYGIDGTQYEGRADVFDNGTYFESSKCFASGMPTGVRGVAKCKFGAPAYMSFPHFYLADPLYRRAVDGMNPNPEIHSTRFSLEPSTGLPLKVYAAFQLNLLMTKVEGITAFSKVRTTLLPCFWFVQRAELSEDLANLAKRLLVADKVGTYTGFGFIGLGSLFLLGFAVFMYRQYSKKGDQVQLIAD